MTIIPKEYKFDIKILAGKPYLVEGCASYKINDEHIISITSALTKDLNLVKPLMRTPIGVDDITTLYKTAEDYDRYFRGNKQVLFSLENTSLLFKAEIRFDEERNIKSKNIHCYVPAVVENNQIIAKELVYEQSKKNPNEVVVKKEFLEGYHARITDIICRVIKDDFSKSAFYSNRVLEG